jgi:K+-sensing histidine kinase KdpD
MAFDTNLNLLKVCVADDGKGIKTEEMSKLFSMFGKLKRTAELNSEGVGMGLMICQNLVRENNGSISAHSIGENMGSVFSFTMQMKPV